MASLTLERLAAIVCSIVCIMQVGASHTHSSAIDTEHGDSRATIKDTCNFQANGDGADSHILLQSFVRNSINDDAPVNYPAERKQGARANEGYTHRKPSDSWKKFWEHPLVLGILLGLFLIGPDHVGTLMALSTLTSGFDSFKRGFSWGAGHSVGVMLLCPIFLTIEHVTSKTMSRESWERYGDTFIGVSMISVSIYFIHFRNSYLHRGKDGTYVAKGCACHGPSTSTTTIQGISDQILAKASMLSVQGCQNSSIDKNGTADSCGVCPASSTASRKLTTPDYATTSTDRGIDDSALKWQFIINSFLGLLQGLCCPVGMTVGTGFMSRITATASTPMLLCFLVEFFFASGVGSGMIALGWGALTRKGSGHCISGQVVYIATSMLLLVFGIAWLVAHSLGMLDLIDFADKIHDRLMPTENTMHF